VNLLRIGAHSITAVIKRGRLAFGSYPEDRSRR
jgi:hypothetical protein